MLRKSIIFLVLVLFKSLRTVEIEECEFHSDSVCRILPNSDHTSKGDSGRIAVIGGSAEYTGAPYFSALTALRVGADIVHVITTKAAAPVIKSYIPDLIVHPILDIDHNDDAEKINSILLNMDVVVIGPGLGRDGSVMDTVTDIIKFLKSHAKPMIIDADGLHLVSKNLKLLQDYPFPGVILTPHKNEAVKLYSAFGIDNNTREINFDKLGKHVTILKKGEVDRVISGFSDANWCMSRLGSSRRAGGQGDMLAGALATFFHWSLKKYSGDGAEYPSYVASVAAARFTRLCNEKAFAKNGRNMITSDMLREIHNAFEIIFVC